MKNNLSIPYKVYLQIAVGFFFSTILIWVLAFRLVFIALYEPFTPEIAFMISVFGSMVFCSFLVKPTFKKLMKNPDAPFSVVARNPAIEIPKEPLTLKTVFLRTIAAIAFTILLNLPFVIISLLQFSKQNVKNLEVLIDSFLPYKYLFIFITLVTLYFVYLVFPSLRKWHWTKHQFTF